MRSVLLVGVVISFFPLACAPTTPTTTAPPNPNPAPAESAPEGMVWIEGGTFWMGNSTGRPDNQPLHKVTLRGFWMDQHEVTNAEFARFVKETGYVTVAERKPKPEDFPGRELQVFEAGSAIFSPQAAARFKFVPGADWRHPEGPNSSIEDRMNHPVVHVCWYDAVAFCQWAGKRLPTEAEWEFAARGGLIQNEFCWGKELKPNGKWMANIWQGDFPVENTIEDGYAATAPVMSFPPNGYGLHDMSGNVWEWVSDWYDPDYFRVSPSENPPGPPQGVPWRDGLPCKVQRGGSFLCHDSYCANYRTYTRHQNTPDSAAHHVGFRCVKDAK